jgi:hypothetical protein
LSVVVVDDDALGESRWLESGGLGGVGRWRGPDLLTRRILPPATPARHLTNDKDNIPRLPVWAWLVGKSGDTVPGSCIKP